MIDAKHYPVEIRPLDTVKGGSWLATFPDLPGYMGDGETPQAAIADGYSAAQAWLSVAQASGDRFRNPAWVVNPGDSWHPCPRVCTPG